ncbi:hypothetical protein NBRC116495_05920 [Aurantivibrio plasticivorans]
MTLRDIVIELTVKTGTRDMFTNWLGGAQFNTAKWLIVSIVFSTLFSPLLAADQTTDDKVSNDVSGLLNVCHSCHMTNEGELARWPNLRGLDQQAIVQKLTAHRAQLIEDGTMSRVTKHLSDQDITDIAHILSKTTQPTPN